MGPENQRSCCSGCGIAYDAWITTCPTCSLPVRSESRPLAEELAAPFESGAKWIDIPVSADQPAEAALLRHFLVENKFEFEQSRRFFSVPASEAGRLEERCELWAFKHEMPPDERIEHSLDGTLRMIGEVVMLAISAAKASVGATDLPATGIDLTS